MNNACDCVRYCTPRRSLFFPPCSSRLYSTYEQMFNFGLLFGNAKKGVNSSGIAAGVS